LELVVRESTFCFLACSLLQEKNNVDMVISSLGVIKMFANGKVFAMAGYSLIVQPEQMLN
jgi:hypothetical protein